MELKSHARSSLESVRQLTKAMLADFNTLKDWFFQPHPNTNHALWIVGHLSLADDAFVAKFRPRLGRGAKDWKSLFWFGSQPLSDPKQCPPVDEVLDYFDDRRNALLQLLDELDPTELNQPAPPAGSPSPLAGAPNIGQVFFFIAQHESMHCGQLSVVRRSLGHPPLYQPAQPAQNVEAARQK